MKVAKGLLSIVGIGGTPKASEAQVQSGAPIQDINDEANNAKKSRAALYQTSNGPVGEELNPDQVKRRQSLLGN